MIKQTIVPWTIYYSTTKRNQLWIYATTWMGLNGIILSEKNQSQKVTYQMIPFTSTQHSQNDKIIVIKNRLAIVRD